jgi:hypothetical protein
MEQYLTTGRFPPSESGKKAYVETEVRTKWPWEFTQTYLVLAVVGLIINILNKMWLQVTGVFR